MTISRYGKTETEQKTLLVTQCREIVSEIMNFGVTDDQVLKIIKFLAMELESRDNLLTIVETIDQISNKNDKLIVDE